MRGAALLLVCLPLLAEQPQDLLARIRASALPAAQRNQLAEALAARKFDFVEEALERQAAGAGSTPQAAELHAMAADAAFLNGHMDQAIRGFQQADARVPLAEADRFTLAMALANRGEADAAREQLTVLDRAHPDRPLYLYWLGRLDYFQRRYTQAVEKFQRVIALDPASARAYDNLGLAYDMMGETGQARQALLKAVELNRKLAAPSPWPPQNLGYLLLRLDQPQPAEAALREALRYDPRFGTAHYHLGRILEAQHRDDEAMREYQAAAALDPSLVESLYSLGLLYRRHNRRVEADAVFAEYRKRKAALPAP